MSTYTKSRHDLAITNVGTDGAGTTLVGMMVARDKGVPVYQVFDGKFLADQFYTNTPSQEYTDPEEEILLSQSDWRSGFGQEIYDSADPKRYYSSIGMDLRWKDMAIAGYAATAIGLPYATGIVDGELDLWNDANNLTNWSKSGTGTLTKEIGSIYSGTASAQMANGAGQTLKIYQTIPWVAAYAGKEVTVKAWIFCGTASAFRVFTDEGGSVVTNGTPHSGVSGWEQVSVTRTLGGGATQLVIGVDAYLASSGAYVDLVSLNIAGGTGSVTAFTEYNGGLYASHGKVLCKCNTALTDFATVNELPTAITDIEPFTDNRLYVACGTTGVYQYANTAGQFTASTSAVKNFQYFKTVHSATPTLWGNATTYTIQSNTAPASGAWAGATTVGSSYYIITDLITKSGAIYIMKENIPYYANTAGAIQSDLAPELQTVANTASGRNSLVYQNAVYIPCGVQSLLRTGTTNEWISPADYCTNLSDFIGRIMALANDDMFLFAAVNNGSKTEILAGRDETIDGNTSWIWHPICELTMTGVSCMFVSSIGKKRLYIASATASEGLYAIDLPSAYGNITADTNRRFANGSYMITPYLHGGFKNTNKAFIKLSVTLGHAYDANIYFTAAYEKLGDTSWTTIGNMIGTSTNRIATAYIPASSTSVNPVSTMMRFKFTAVTNDTTKTPIMNQYTVSSILYPEIKSLIYAQVVCSEDIACKNGMIDKNMKDTIITTLDNARNASWPVSIRDLDGNTQTVKLLPLPRTMPRFIVTKDEKGRETERLYNILMQIRALS